MKKIITMVLALAMVFALAAGASALVPENALTTVNRSDRYDLKVELAGGPVSAGSTIVIPSVIANKAYVQNEVLYYAVTVTAKKGYVKTTQKEDAALVISGAGVNLNTYASNFVGYYYDATGAIPTWAKLAMTLGTHYTSNAVYNNVAVLPGYMANEVYARTHAATNSKYDTTYVFSGMGLVNSTAVAPSITAKIYVAAMTKGTAYIGINPIYQITKLESLTATPADPTNTWAVQDVTTGAALTFKSDATGKCIYIGYTEAGSTNPPVQIVKGDYVTALGAWTNNWLDIAGNQLTAADQAVVERIMTFMGFDYNLRDTNAILDADFLRKTTETNLTATATGNVFADNVTTDTITVVPEVSTPVIEVPKTGSEATFAGIALVVLAAAAAFVCKKVRA